MSTIFLTGGTGFLGSHLADALVGAGHRVTASVRRTSDTRRLDQLGIDRVELDLGPSGGGRETVDALAACDVVVHCGALTRARNETEFMAVNATGTRKLARAAADAGIRRFVFISSLAARGPDGRDGPVSPYGRSKAVAERALSELGGSMEIAVLRPGGVYGPRDSDLLPLFRLAARGWTVIPGSGARLQPVFVSDVVSAVLAALDAGPSPDPLPIAAAESHSWSGVARNLMAAVGRPGRVVRVPPALFLTIGALSEFGSRLAGTTPAMDRRRARDLAVHAWTCDVGPSRRQLDPWCPRVGITEGLARTAEWYRRKGWL
ncbi:NAD-dependent epimerase/dehydratase family protein [Candidatus Palauibacter sp.]|uniref:NAD-dependent epimerase/dehydratase family protein n=1 Tax=Candidatus Palauibacter sp. TaxID=3101350 RepID=UPI003B5B5269